MSTCENCGVEHMTIPNKEKVKIDEFELHTRKMKLLDSNLKKLTKWKTFMKMLFDIYRENDGSLTQKDLEELEEHFNKLKTECEIVIETASLLFGYELPKLDLELTK